MHFAAVAACCWLTAWTAFADQRNFIFNVGNPTLTPDGLSRPTVMVNGQFPGPRP